MIIAGMGTAVPEYSVTQKDAAEVAGKLCCATEAERQWLRDVYEASGVQRRHSVLLNGHDGPATERQSFVDIENQTDPLGPTLSERMRRYESAAGPLATRAAAAALDDAAVPANQISHLITVSCTGFSAPGFDFDIIKALSLSSAIARTHIGFMGCHGALNGLRVANAFAQSDPSACVLLCAVELCSLHHYFGWDLEKIVANALFADGAAALVGTAQVTERATNGSHRSLWRVIAQGSFMLPETERAMTWRIADHGFEMTLFRKVPNLIHKHLGPWLTEWLRSIGLSIGDVRSWAIHPGGPRIVSACANAAGIADELLSDSRAVLEQFGNMSSPTVLFLLDRFRRRQAPRPCVALGFGPGMVVEAALIGD
jgi:predicted naringenin-chalcone synthase